MFEKEAEEWAKENMDCVKTENCLNQDCNYFSDEERIIAKSAFKDGAEFGYNKANEQLALPKDILSLWQQTVCEIRSEIKSWDLKGPHVSDYAKVLCDKLARSMCAVAGAPYCMRYSITD